MLRLRRRRVVALSCVLILQRRHSRRPSRKPSPSTAPPRLFCDLNSERPVSVALHHRHTKNKSSDWRLIRANFNQQHDGGRSIDALKARYQNVIKANEGFAKPAPKSKRSV